MKKFYKRMLIVSLILALCIGLSSCDLLGESSTIEGTTTSIYRDPYVFDSVLNLKATLKNDLSKYENRQITIIGTISKSSDSIILSDVSPTSNAGVQFRYDAKKNPHITIIILDNKKAMLLDSGDYVKIYGTVRVSNSEIYLDNCEYEIIKSIYD